MKVNTAAVERFIRRPDPAVRAILVYGRDEGLVHERADALVQGVVPDLGDPFRVAEVTPSRLDDDPARLADEAAALSLSGGRRVVRVRPASDAQAEILERFLSTSIGDTLVVVEGGDLGPKSRLRLAFERSATAAALPCYPDEGAGLRELIEKSLTKQQFSVEPDALDFLASTLGGDRLATRAELEKLTIYMGSERRITLADVAANVGDSSIINLESAVIAAMDGDLAGLERSLTRAYLEGASPIALLRTSVRYLERLHRVVGRVARGDAPVQAIKSLRPKPYFKVADAIERQIKRWSVGRIARAMAFALEAEIACKATGAPAPLLCSRALMRLARAARP